MEISKQEQLRLTEKTDLINQYYENSFSFLHQLLHKCNNLTSLSENSNNDLLKAEINDLANFTFNKFNLINCNSKLFNKILNQFSQELIENNIDFRSTIKSEKILFLNENDAITIFSYLLSNIIDTCKYIETNRFIIIYSKDLGARSVIQIHFSANIDISFKKNDIIELFKKNDLVFDQSHNAVQQISSITIWHQ